MPRKIICHNCGAEVRGESHVKRDTRPTLLEVTAYCQERKNSVDPDTWFDFYQSKGWLVGKTPMKDWRAAVRTWERRETPALSGAVPVMTTSPGGKIKMTEEEYQAARERNFADPNWGKKAVSR